MIIDVMKDIFRAAIENEYGIVIKSCKEAARGQVSRETYILQDQEGRQYFCKIIDRPDFISLIYPTLPVVREMYDKGLSCVCAPIRGKHGLSVKSGDTLLALYDFIDADQSYHYDLLRFGKTLGDIHELTTKLTAKLPVRGYSSFREEFLTQTLPYLTSTKSNDDIVTSLSNVLEKYAEETQAIINTFLRLKETCNQKYPPFVNTHGDIHGNVLVNSSKSVYIIDWDELENGPAERDLWLLSEKPEFMEGYRQARPDFMPNPDALKHAMLKNYLEGIPIYLNPILDERLAPEIRLSYLEKLENKRFKGWMKPKVLQIIDELK